jgi:hypothetical protein
LNKILRTPSKDIALLKFNQIAAMDRPPARDAWMSDSIRS